MARAIVRAQARHISGGGPFFAGGDQLRMPWTVRGDRFWRGTIYGVTLLHSIIYGKNDSNKALSLVQ